MCNGRAYDTPRGTEDAGTCKRREIGLVAQDVKKRQNEKVEKIGEQNELRVQRNVRGKSNENENVGASAGKRLFPLDEILRS